MSLFELQIYKFLHLWMYSLWLPPVVDDDGNVCDWIDIHQLFGYIIYCTRVHTNLTVKWTETYSSTKLIQVSRENNVWVTDKWSILLVFPSLTAMYTFTLDILWATDHSDVSFCLLSIFFLCSSHSRSVSNL